MRGTPGALIWQRSYYEHISRNDGELERIRAYIDANPARWGEKHSDFSLAGVPK